MLNSATWLLAIIGVTAAGGTFDLGSTVRKNASNPTEALLMPLDRRPLMIHVVPGLRRAGAETMLLNLLQRANREPFRHEVVVLGPAASMLADFETAGVPVHQMNMRRGFPTPAGILRFISCLRRLRPRLVQGWMYQANVAVSAAAPFLPSSVAFLWNVRRCLDDLHLQSVSLRLAFRASRMLSHRPSAVIFNSQRAMRQHLQRGFCEQNAFYIPNGFHLAKHGSGRLSPRAVLGLPDNAFLFGMIGRFHPTKNHRLFLSAAKSMADARTFFVLAGEGIDRANRELATMIDSLGLRDRCLLLGELTNAADVMSGLDALVLSSLSEGFPNVVGEAMSCGVPCIVTDVGDAAELVGQTGLIVPSNDLPSLTAALDQMRHMDVEQRRQLGQSARNRIEERYSIDVVARSYESLYERLLIGGRTGQARVTSPIVSSPRTS
jgi:glycosyltransferase involved in cell wall biosynthesis